MVVLFVLAVIAIVLAVDLVVYLAGFGRVAASDPASAPQGSAPDFTVLAWVSVLVAAIIGLTSLFRLLQLRSGGATVARSMGATPVAPDTTDPAWQRLRNVIEEIAIAAGVPVPDIFVMENETAINAFAAGFSPADAAVCVTQGCLEALTRDELQGVIAHEFSHVLNGDMRLNIRLIGLLFGILALASAGRLVMYSGAFGGGRRNNSSGYTVLLGMALLLIGSVGYFFGRIIQASVSRARESLADASAVQFTRQTDGIAGALKKIAVLEDGSLLTAQETTHVAHMLFGEGLAASRLFATHPPLLERIKALQPEFDPDELEDVARKLHARLYAPPAEPVPPETTEAGGTPQSRHFDIPGLEGMEGAAVVATSAAILAGASGNQRKIHVSANEASNETGTFDPAHISLAGAMHAHIPEGLAQAARDPGQVMLLLLAMGVARNQDASRAAQLEAAVAEVDDTAAARIRALADEVATLHPALYLPLAILVFPALRRLPPSRLQWLSSRLDTIVHADGQLVLHEYCLVKMLQVQVVDVLTPSRAHGSGNLKLGRCSNEMRDLFALVADHGHSETADARRAFQAACDEALPGHALDFDVPDNALEALDKALARLDKLNPAGKELVVRGLACAIRFDGQVTVAEAELLRVTCAALHCPLPPFLADDH